MKLLEMIIFAMQLRDIVSKKKLKEISSESIENILYYKDCNHKQMSTEVPALRSPALPPAPAPECKMLCTMCCGEQCVDSHQMKLGRQASGVQQIQPEAVQPMRPIPPRERRKKLKPSPPLQPLVPGRRGFGFTRENIKSLISRDEDIRKILKDLVRVTMQKADLMQLMDNKQSLAPAKSEYLTDGSDSVNDL